VFAQDAIAELATVLSDFTVTTCVWRPESDPAWDGFIGTPVDALARDLAETGELPDVFVCAPPPMVDAVGQLLARQRGSPGFDSEG
jgi:NAD(P)H-flavin reductase